MYKTLYKQPRTPPLPTPHQGSSGTPVPSPRGLFTCTSWHALIAALSKRGFLGLFWSDKSSSRRPSHRGQHVKNRRPFSMFVMLLSSALFLIAVSTFLFEGGSQQNSSAPPLNASCVEFVQTRRKQLIGAVLSVQTCDYKVPGEQGGYCVCGGRVAVQALGAWMPFMRPTCQTLCATTPASASMSIPSSTSCPAGTPSFFQDPHLSFNSPLTTSTSQKFSPAVAWWTQLQQTLLLSDVVVLPPGPRNKSHDFVAQGFTMQPEHISHVHKQWKQFLQTAERLASSVPMADVLPSISEPCVSKHTAPENSSAILHDGSGGAHPALCDDSVTSHSSGDATTRDAANRQQRNLAGTFSGEGVAILSGAAPYFVPSLIALKTLRHTGCALPVEIWMPDSEAPSPADQRALQQELSGLGAVLKILPVSSGWHPQRFSMCNNGTRVHLKFSRSMQGGYYLKAVVVAVSSFQKLLFIDADNVPITDPSALFQSAEFKKTGVLMWRDYWDASYAPDVPAVLGVKRSAMPPHTYDSGQMLFDKSRFLFAPLFTNFMGLGDKETFAFALIAHDLPFSTIEHRTIAVGITSRVCSFGGLGGCWDEVVGNTMAQKDPEGSLMFMHTNMPPKWTLAVPEEFDLAVRRWQAISPGEHAPIDNFVQLSIENFGFDLERDVHSFLIQARCNDLVLNLTIAQEAAAGKKISWNAAQIANQRLPSKPREVRLSQTFEDPGLTGDFLKRIQPTWTQWIMHWWNSRRFGRTKHQPHSTSVLVERKDVSLWKGHW